ncbi:hypothetical protein XELAEV_18001271mg [Xenopus laevis]|uniref:Uncharacterized protein n=1 Tax=Xenopus laevis TaxID=8355 RepID=A0A974GYH5_XENLA|nr:hypothetical protein XELAEV_18001271mg [Xenopus laevis]
MLGVVVQQRLQKAQNNHLRLGSHSYLVLILLILVAQVANKADEVSLEPHSCVSQILPHRHSVSGSEDILALFAR